MKMGGGNIIELEQGWDHMRKAMTKLKNILEGVPGQSFDTDQYSLIHSYPFKNIVILCLA